MAGKSSAIRAGAAFIELFTADGGLRRGLDAAQQRLKVWSAAVSSIGLKAIAAGTAAITPLIAASKVFQSMGDSLAKASTRTGIGVERLSELAYAAEQSGTDLAGLETGIRQMQKTLLSAAKGSDEAVDSLARLGLTIKDLSGLSPDEQFKLIADRMNMVADPTLKAANAMAIFGKSGTSLIPLMQGGAAGIEELAAQSRRLGLTWSTKDAKAAEEFGDRADDLWKVLKKLGAEVGAAVVPALREFFVISTKAAVGAMKWVQENRAIIATAFKIAAGVVAAGTALLVLGKTLGVVGAAVGAASTVLGLFGATVGAIAVVLKTALFSSIGLVITALGGLGAWLLYSSDAGSKALTFLGDMFRTLKGIAGDTIKGIQDALKAGDWETAADIMWLGLKTVFTAGANELKEVWRNLAGYFVEQWIIAMQAIKIATAEVTSAIAALILGAEKGVGMIPGAIGGVLSGNLDFKNQLLAEAMGQATGQIPLDPELQQLEDLKQQELANIAEELKAKLAAVGAVDAAEREADKKRLDELRAKLKQTTDKAAADAARAATVAPIAPRVPTPADLAATLDDVAKKTVSVRGTFNAAAVLGLAAGGPLGEIATATKETAKHTRELARTGRHAPSLFFK